METARRQFSFAIFLHSLTLLESLISKIAFCQTTHGRIARQTPDVIEAHGDHCDRCTQTSSSQRSLAARMTSAHDNDVD